MITNKDIRVENGFLIINGDKFPLDGQSPETIMEIVEDNSDSTPTAESTAPVTSAGIKTYVDTAIGDLTQTGITGADVAAQLAEVDSNLSALTDKVVDNTGTLTQRLQLSATGSDTYTVQSDSAIAVVQFEGYCVDASDVFDGEFKVNGVGIGYFGIREGVACSPAKREIIRIPFRVYKNDVISISLSLTGATGYVTLLTT